MELIEILKALGDENRIRILNLLKDGDLCVCQMESILKLNQSNVSRHLTRLSSSRIIKNYKKAQFVYYKISDETLNNYTFITEILNNETTKLEKCINDSKRLVLFKENHINCENIEDLKDILVSDECEEDCNC